MDVAKYNKSRYELLENKVMIRKIWMHALETHRALAGTPFLFSLRKKAGMVWSPAAE